MQHYGNFEIYTNGICRDNQNNQPGPHHNGREPQGAIGVYSGEGVEVSEVLHDNHRPHTSERAQLVAVWAALSRAPAHRPIVVWTNSLNVVHSFTVWINDWLRSGGYGYDGHPVANWDLIQTIWQQIEKLGNVAFGHVPEEASEYGITRARQLAQQALNTVPPRDLRAF